jgi:hypothetical protein
VRLIQVQREAISLHERQTSGNDTASIGDVLKLRQVQPTFFLLFFGCNRRPLIAAVLLTHPRRSLSTKPPF